MQVLGWSPKGPLAGLLGGTDASSVADGSFDAVLGGMLETPATGGGVGTFGGAGSGGAGSGGSGAVPSEAASSEAASLAAASGATSGRFVGLLQGVPGARHDGQRGIESELSGAGKSDHLDDSLSGRFVGSLRNVPGARHDRQRGIEMADGVASSTVRLDDSLSIRRLLPSSTQVPVETVSASSLESGGGVPVAGMTGVGRGQGGAGIAGSGTDAAEGTSGRFVGSLQGVPGARHDRQRGIEMADGVASSTVRLDGSLSIRRLLPSSAQEAVETGSSSSLVSGGGVPVAGMTGVGRGQGGAGIAGSGTDAAEGTSGRFVGSLQGVPGARHDRQRGIEMADGVASSTVRLDDPLSIRRLLPSSAQEAVEGGSASSPLFGGVPGVVGTGVGGGRSGAVLAGVVQGSGMSSGVGSAAAMSAGGSLAGLGSDVDASSGRFVGSLRNMPGARHDPQRGIESADGVASSNGRLDDSLSIRRLLPSSAQEAVETGSAVVADPGTAVAQPATPGVEAAPQPSAAVVHPSGKAAPGQTAPGQPGPEGSHHARAALDQAALVQAAPDRAALDQAVLVQAAPDPAALDQAVLVQAAPGQSGPEGSHHARAALDQAVLVQTAPGQATPVQPTPAQPTQTQPPNPGQLHQQSLNHPPLNHQLAQPLFELASAKPGEHVMTLRVSPEDLGPLTVRAHIDHAGVRIELFAAGDAGREAVRHVLPELRRGLEDAGATLNLSSQDSPQDSPHDNPQDAPTDRGDQRRHEPVFQAQAPQNVATGREPEQPKHDPETNRLDILV